ncbi:MAG: hypothetical protein IKU45_01900 [Clostridia bacterium]|nr:hypothetical protein [Clostridia bacterium]
MTKKLLVGNAISEKCLASLEKRGYELTLLPPFSKLQKGVSHHADMLFFYFGGELLTHIDYYRENREILDRLGVKINTTDENISHDYPNDILFNTFLTEDKILFAKEKYVSEKIKQFAKTVVDVKQGYTSCSTCRVANNAFITTDSGLFKAYSKNGIDALLVEKEGIFLQGYNCGFIGGASVVFDDSVCFFGSLSGYKDGQRVREFVEKHGKNVVDLSDEKLTDIGGCIVL